MTVGDYAAMLSEMQNPVKGGSKRFQNRLNRHNQPVNAVVANAHQRL
jgi:hypothetical protein